MTALIIMAALSYIAAGIAVSGYIAFDYGQRCPRPDKTEAERMAELRTRALIAFAFWPLVSVWVALIALWRLSNTVPSLIVGLYHKGIEARAAKEWESQSRHTQSQQIEEAAEIMRKAFASFHKAGPP